MPRAPLTQPPQGRTQEASAKDAKDFRDHRGRRGGRPGGEDVTGQWRLQEKEGSKALEDRDGPGVPVQSVKKQCREPQQKAQHEGGPQEGGTVGAEMPQHLAHAQGVA